MVVEVAGAAPVAVSVEAAMVVVAVSTVEGLAVAQELDAKGSVKVVADGRALATVADAVAVSAQAMVASAARAARETKEAELASEEVEESHPCTRCASQRGVRVPQS